MKLFFLARSRFSVLRKPMCKRLGDRRRNYIPGPVVDLIDADSICICYFLEMNALQALRRDRWSGSLLASVMACLLFIEAMMMSVGLGMSAAAAEARPGHAFAICSASTLVARPETDRNIPSPRPHCPYCYIAAQIAGHVGTAGHAPNFPAHVAFDSADAIYGRFNDQILVLPLRRRVSDPRAPPNLSV